MPGQARHDGRGATRTICGAPPSLPVRIKRLLDQARDQRDRIAAIAVTVGSRFAFTALPLPGEDSAPTRWGDGAQATRLRPARSIRIWRGLLAQRQPVLIPPSPAHDNFVSGECVVALGERVEPDGLGGPGQIEELRNRGSLSCLKGDAQPQGHPCFSQPPVPPEVQQIGNAAKPTTRMPRGPVDAGTSPA